jgi:CheY-like chemotaxis protein/HPt (histidine-containing phosphotransfer) domain-containing protein
LQLISNLVSNAIKFTPKGKVSLNLSLAASLNLSHPSRERVTIRADISDTGVGIPREVQAKLFRPFVQADASTTRRYGGTGLGLSICKQLVELMGGTIGVESEEGLGSRFWFTLDLKVGKSIGLPAPEDQTFPKPKPRTGRTPHVLVAEDNVTNQKVAVLTLEKLGYQATPVANGQEAIDALREIPFDLVLMDCQMPEMDGYEATRIIRASRTLPNPGIPIIAMTANALPADRERCLKAGMNDYLPKPVRTVDLQSMLERWLPPVLPDRNASRTPTQAGPALAVRIIDDAVIRELRSLSTPGTDDAFCEITQVYLSNSRERIARMKAACAEGALGKIVVEAHSMKSSSGNVGAIRLPPLCREIEERAKAGKGEGLAALIDQLAKEFASASQELQKLLDESGKSQAA